MHGMKVLERSWLPAESSPFFSFSKVLVPVSLSLSGWHALGFRSSHAASSRLPPQRNFVVIRKVLVLGC